MQGERILLIEDDRELQNIIYTFLSREGYEVKQAYDGEEVSICQRNSAHAYPADLMIPKTTV